MTGCRRGAFLLLTIAWLAAVGGCARSGAPARPRDVVLLTVDTLRRDRVGVYGDPTTRTPTLDRLARAGALAELAVAPFGRTSQSVGSLHTGLHPLRHGADFLGAKLPERVSTLAELFGAAGYRTIAFVANRNLETGLGFEQGFDEYTNRRTWWAGNPGSELIDESIRRLRGVRGEAAPPVERDRPLFLWVHLLEPHWPYTPRPLLAAARSPEQGGRRFLPRGFPEGLRRGHLVFEADRRFDPDEVAYGRALYDGEVEEADLALRRLVRELEVLGVSDHAALAFTSDHGESLGEHRYWFSHGQYAYEASLRVPLMVAAPGAIARGATLRGTVRLEDLAPTLLGLGGVAVPDGLDGQDLTPALTGERGRGWGGGVSVAPERAAVHLTDHTHVSNLNERQKVEGREGRWWVYRERDWKFLQIPLEDGRAEEELYDLAADPGERRNLAASASDVADRMRERLEAVQELWTGEGAEPLGDAEPESLDAARIEALRSLGYID